MVRYVCMRCGYKYQPKSAPTQCPWCNGKSLLQEVTAEELVKCVDGMV